MKRVVLLYRSYRERYYYYIQAISAKKKLVDSNIKKLIDIGPPLYLM